MKYGCCVPLASRRRTLARRVFGRPASFATVVTKAITLIDLATVVGQILPETVLSILSTHRERPKPCPGHSERLGDFMTISSRAGDWFGKMPVGKKMKGVVRHIEDQRKAAENSMPMAARLVPKHVETKTA